jgi:hypothetical protein
MAGADRTKGDLMTPSPPNRPSDAAALLAAALNWRHTQAGWCRVEEALTLVVNAVDRGDQWRPPAFVDSRYAR